MDRYICIHCHFYQPPRENPWLEAVEVQDSAYPYHDWNERITAECYGPNSAARILDGHNRIVSIVNNYSKISFNVGPTLLSWLEENASDVYRRILYADQASQKLYSGHGSAMAQAYNHMIMPLANSRDKRTQVLWGLTDFAYRFGRKPEGMWLAETAVDLETLDILAEQGIAYTVLSPYQARRDRKIGENKWRDVQGGRVDPSVPYLLRLPSGRKIALFFYDGPVSRAVAFQSLLDKGEYLAARLAQAFSAEREWPQLVHIATDGETYGHHRAHGDMALAYALEHIEQSRVAKLTNYGEHLERYPPFREVEIIENSSWSCIHGVERWQSNCGCNSGTHPGWNQEWRGPLRRALDWLRDELASRFFKRGQEVFRDPWAARDRYIDVLLNRAPASTEAFMARERLHPSKESEEVVAYKLLELQRHAMLMYTSCGWFFDELSGIETVQVMQYAARALHLSEEIFGTSLESGFLERLESAKSNLPELANGRRIYEQYVRPVRVTLEQAGAHFAVSSLFESYRSKTRAYCYTVTTEDYRLLSSGKARLALGRADVRSDIVHEAKNVTFGVLHLGDHNLSGGVREYQGEEAYERLCREVTEVFQREEFAETRRVVDKHFGTGSYTLKLLFRDEQRKILRLIVESALEEAELVYRQLFERYSPLMRFHADLHLKRPRALEAAAEFTLNAELRHALTAARLDVDHVRARLEEAARTGVTLDQATLEFALRAKLQALAEAWCANPTSLSGLEELETAAALTRSFPFVVDLWAVQNGYFDVLQVVYPEMAAKAQRGNGPAQRWMGHFRGLAELLGVRVDGHIK
jgi:alpha-amylase/alpha-mannosidase (GH57 family)